MLSDEDILKLYQDPTFPGSFSGVKNLKHFITRTACADSKTAVKNWRACARNKALKDVKY